MMAVVMMHMMMVNNIMIRMMTMMMIMVMIRAGLMVQCIENCSLQFAMVHKKVFMSLSISHHDGDYECYDDNDIQCLVSLTISNCLSTLSICLNSGQSSSSCSFI